jgi:iron complex transport system substrate-binding protein
LAARRIVSLLPSATEIVCALGLGDRLVGVSHSCDYPAEVLGKPRVSRPRTDFAGMSSGEIDAAVRATLRDHGSVYEVDVEQIAALKPDLILTQGICDVCAVPEKQVLSLDIPANVLTLDAHDLSAILAGIRDVGRATGTDSRAHDLVKDIERRIAAVQRRVAGQPRPRVLALEWLDPPYVPGHWVPELIELAGGDLLAGTARRPSYRLDWPELEELHPDLVLIMPCGFTAEESQCEAERRGDQLSRIGGHVHVLDASSYFSRSGPRVVDGLEMLASTFADFRRLPPSSAVLYF